MWRRFASSISASSSRHTRMLCVSRTSRLSNALLWKSFPAIVADVFDTEAFVDITSPITNGEETSISRPVLSRDLHNLSLPAPPWRFPQGGHRRAASRVSKIADSPRQTNSLLQCNSGQMMETARRQIVRAMKIRGVFQEFECWKYARPRRPALPVMLILPRRAGAAERVSPPHRWPRLRRRAQRRRS